MNITIKEIKETEYKLIEQIPIIIRERYGEHYSNSDFYNVNILKQLIESKKLTICGAVSQDGELMGIEGAGDSPFFDNTCVFMLRIVKKVYCGHKLGNRISSMVFRLADSSDFSCAYAYTRTNSESSIRNLTNHGFVITGMLIGDCYTGENIKRSHHIMVKPLKKQNAGKIFVPQKLTSQVKSIYEKLGVSVQLCQSKNNSKDKNQICEQWYYPNHRHLLVKLCRLQESSTAYVMKLIEKHKSEQYFTADILINMNDEYCPKICSELLQQGLVFTGIQPLCADGEFIVFHFIGNNDYILEDGEVI